MIKGSSGPLPEGYGHHVQMEEQYKVFLNFPAPAETVCCV